MRSVTKVIYKPDSQSTEEYTVIVDPSEFQKWKAGDTTIPLTEVVDSFNVYHSAQGSQGLLNTPSNQQLDTVFGTHKDIDVVTKILKDGREQRGELDDNWADTNMSRGSAEARGVRVGGAGAGVGMGRNRKGNFI